MDEVSTSLKEALLETLSDILSPVQEERAAAEQRLKALEVTEDFGFHLTEITINSNNNLSLRQLASVLLKQYVETHWSSNSDKFQPPEALEEAKVTIRQMLLRGLNEPSSKVRSSVAYAVSAIAHWDWPEHWPDLFNTLVSCLSGESNWAVHGAMRVLTEFSRDITDTQFHHIAPVILSEMYRIFVSDERYNVRIRGRAVEIFGTCVYMISVMAEYNKGVAKSILTPVLPSFCAKLVQGLAVADGALSDCGLKMEIMKALTLLMKHVPKLMSHWLHEVLGPVWTLLTRNCDYYVRSVVNSLEHMEEIVDSDGGTIGFENLILSIFEFVHAVIESPKFRKEVAPLLTNVMYYLIHYMKITEEQIQMWCSNLNRFVEDEDEDTYSYSVRISAQDLMLSLCKEIEDESLIGLGQAIVRHSQEAQEQRQHENNFWWKTHEACLLALGSVKDLLIGKLKTISFSLNVQNFLESVITSDVELLGYPFLVGRCLWTGSRYASILSREILSMIARAIVASFQNNYHPVVRISSVRAILEFSEFWKVGNNKQDILIYIPSFFEGLITLATQFSCEVLSLVMESLSVVLSIDDEVTATYESKISPLAIAVFLKYHSDPVIISLAQDIFKELSKNPKCLLPLQQRLVPTIVSILNAPAERIQSGLHATALDVLQILIRYSQNPLNNLLMEPTFYAVCDCVMRSDDSSTMQSGGECIRCYLSVAPYQVCNFQDHDGRTGLWYVMQITVLLLSPNTSEFTAMFVGRLVVTLIKKTGDVLGDELEFLLKAVLSKMQRVEAASVMQSLLLVYANLVHSQFDAVLGFLAKIPGPTGQSALQYVFSEWCSKQHLFVGAYERKIFTIALCKLLEYGLASEDNPLKEITVKGDLLLVDASVVYRTRSQTQANPDQWTQIPILVKMYKLIIYELADVIEHNLALSNGESETDDEENDFCDEGSNVENQGVPISSILGSVIDLSSGANEDTDDEDLDAIDDPIYHINLQAYLTEFVQKFNQHPASQFFNGHLTIPEKQTLASIALHV